MKTNVFVRIIIIWLGLLILLPSILIAGIAWLIDGKTGDWIMRQPFELIFYNP